MILLDENTTCHLALGSCYAMCLEGALGAEDRKKYVESLGGNFDADGHVDFMIGGPNVMVYAEKPGNPDDKVLLIKNDKFQMD